MSSSNDPRFMSESGSSEQEKPIKKRRIRPTKVQKPASKPAYPSLAKCIAIKRLLEGLELPPTKQKQKKNIHFETQTEEREDTQEEP